MDSPDVRYSVWVLGGFGTVDFEALSSRAIGHAPPGADRDAIIQGIGRGIGRATVHEFAHLLLSGVNLHAGWDAGSYEYARVSRAAQFYGPIHWDFAQPLLLEATRSAGG